MDTENVRRVVHSRATRASMSEIATCLQSVLGQRLTAVLAGVNDAKAVGQWARGTRVPHPEAERRLRDAYQVVGLLLEYDKPETVRAWFAGMNPHLGDQAPALVVATDPGSVVEAAQAFIASG
jgi:hypothetical protein